MTIKPNNFKRDELLEAIEALRILEEKQKYNKIGTRFLNSGRLGRAHYPKHMEFLEAGSKHLIRAFVAANRIGKTELAGYEIACHLTGRYPDWWKGKKYNRPCKGWVVGIETKQIRSSIQPVLFGDMGDPGTGLIPKDCLLDEDGKPTWKNYTGTPDLIGTARVKHFTDGIFDGWSEVEVKTYEQGWMNFQGAKRDWIWLDEEPTDEKIYAECMTRLMGDEGDEGIMLCTFTPLHGYSQFLLGFLPNGQLPPDGVHPNNPEKKVVMATWDDCPHLSERARNSLLEEYLKSDPNAVEARTKGIAAMGSGKVYPIDEQFVIVPKFRIPDFWPKCYGIDPGQANFAVVWIAEDPNTGVKYIYDEYKHGKVNYVIHVDAIKNRGEWIQGGIDPHEAVKPRDTGETVHSYFESQGLGLMAAKGDPDALRLRIRAMFDAGSLKIVDNCIGLLNEVRTYRYDITDPNKIAKGQEDHRLDALLYGICVFETQAQSHAQMEEETHQGRRNRNDDYSDYGRNPTTGY